MFKDGRRYVGLIWNDSLGTHHITAAPPTTKVVGVKRQSGRQKGIKGTPTVYHHYCVYSTYADQTLVAQAALDDEGCNLRMINVRFLALERILQAIEVTLQDLFYLTQESKLLIMALYTHLGITPSLVPGFDAATRRQHIHKPNRATTGFAVLSPIPRHADMNCSVGDEDEEPSQVCPCLVPCLWKVIMTSLHLSRRSKGMP